MRTITLAAIAATLVFAGGALGAKDGNAGNAKLCLNGGWANLMSSTAQPFANQHTCLGYAVHGGAIYALATIHVEACASQPYDGICAGTTGSGLEPGSVLTITTYKNSSPVKEEFPVVQGDGTVNSSPTQSFDAQCVAGNEWSIDATGASADSLSSPTVPGIPVTSNTVERTSACP